MQKVITSFLIAFVLLMVVIILTRTSYNNIQKFEKKAEKSRVAIKQYQTVDIQLRSAEIYTPGYANSIATDLFRLYQKDLNEIEPNIKQLKFLTKDEPGQAAIVDTLEAIILQQLPTLRKKNILEIIASDGVHGVADIEKAHRLIEKGLKLQEADLRSKSDELTDANHQNNLFTIILAILAIIIITATFFQQFFLSKKSQWLEGFLESILNTTQNGIVYYKAVRTNGKITDFTIEYANETIKSLLGIDPKQIVGKQLSDLDLSVRNPEVFPIYVNAVENGEPVQFEHFYRHADIERWLYFSIKKLHDGITVAFHNISDLKRYEGELKKNITALEESNKELEEYAYAASHDLQEPLRKIRTFGGFLRDQEFEKLDEKGKQQIEKIIQSTERMSLLIKDLLSFSSLKNKDKFEETDLNEIFENVVQDLEVLIAQKDATITHDHLPEITAIPIQINQLFYNLVNNALKFSKPNTRLHLDVSCRKMKGEEVSDVTGLEPSASYYEIVFSDNGIGFNQDYAAQIFGMFKRLNDRSHYAGSGIGLALCRKVVHNHGGV
ncbi:MAG: hypothetical protein EON98_03230, partial [Chitinophagaceae bacterium]